MEIRLKVAQCQQITDVAKKAFSGPSEILMEFEYMGESYIVWEPYGDSSRYWIGAKDDNRKDINIVTIEKEFQQHHPFVLRKIFGDIISLKIFQKN